MTDNYFLELFCFRGFYLKIDGQGITDFRTTRVQALLAYLAVEQGVPTRRETLAGLLWPDEPERNARHNLSQTLFHLRRSIRDQATTPPLLRINAQTLELNPESAQWVDVVKFETYLANVQQHAHAALHQCNDCLEQLRQALALYRGPFLDGFSVPRSDLFEQWLVTKREYLQQQALGAFALASAIYEEKGHYEAAQQMLRRSLELVPDQEEAHAQLMRVLALSGQRSRALAQYETCCQILDAELGVEPAAETVALYEQIRDGLLESKPLPKPPEHKAAQIESLGEVRTKPPTPIPYQAPGPPPHFVGRETELAQLRAKIDTQSLEQTGLQVIALVGMGGIGKTALAAQAAHHLRELFPDGVLWANGAHSLPVDIVASWARAFDYDFSNLPDLESRAAALRGRLAGKHVLMILDNVVSAADVKTLFPNSSTCTALLTMRDLDVAHALNAQVLLLGELSPHNARQILVRLLGEDRVAAEEEAAVEICALLQNLPLAVEIVAQRLKSRPRQRLEAMATRLRDERFRLGLEISDRAVRTSFEVSWAALDESRQRLFALLAVFAGRVFHAKAIAAIAEIEEVDAEDALFGLEALSLVKAGRDIYFRHHPLLADFAQEKLTQELLVDVDAVRSRMSNYYFDFVSEKHQDVEELLIEQDNIFAAVEIAYQQKAWERLFGFSDRLLPITYKQGLFVFAGQLCEWVHVGAQAQDDKIRQASNLFSWGEADSLQSKYDRARKHLTKSLTLYQILEDETGIANVKERLAAMAIERGELDVAEPLIDACLSHRLALNVPIDIAGAYYLQALVCFYKEAYEEADNLTLKALVLLQECESVEKQIPILCLLAHIENRRQAYDQAQLYAERALRIGHEEDYHLELAGALYTLTTIHRHQRNFESALSTGIQGLDYTKRMGLRRNEGQMLYQLSVIQKELENYEEAITLNQQSIEVFRDLQVQLSCAYSLRFLGDIYQTLGQMIEAKSAWHEAESLGHNLNHTTLLSSLSERLVAL
ncbi:hypothetical protein KFU94_16370 [Chloroflexi bacterium TSY]|nr:hypothetical protein [Chloroflexi bacterium TSY]